MGQPGRVRNRQGLGRRLDDLGRAHRLERPGRDDLIEPLAGGPFGDDVGLVGAIIGVEDTDQPRITQLGG